MSLVGRLLRSTPFDNPQVPMTAANVAYFLDLFGGGRTDSNEIVTPLTSLQLATAFGCVRLLSDQVGICPQWVYERILKGKRLARDHYLFDLVSLSPNPETTAVVLKQTMVAQILLWGGAFHEIERNGAGQPISLIPRGAWKTKPVRRNGKLVFETTDNAEGELRYVDPENMIHVPYVSLDGQVGLSPVSIVRQTFGTGLAMDKFSARFFGNFATPQLAIEYPGLMKSEDKTRARNDWEALQSGSNAHRVAILDGGSKVTPLSMPLDDAQFLESKQLNATQICGLYGVPPHMLGLVEKAVKANVEQQSIEIVQYTLSPILVRIDQEMNRKLLPSTGRTSGKYFIGFDTRMMRLPDAAGRTTYFQSMLQNGAMVQDEVREIEGFNAYEGDLGSQPMVQLNMQSLAALSSPAVPSESGDQEIEQNSLLSKLARAYSPIFRDGLGRFLHRQKRDFAGLQACLGPCVDAISVTLRGDLIAAPASGAALRSLLQNWAVVSSAWTLETAAETTRDELRAAIPIIAKAAAADIRAAAVAKQALARQSEESVEEEDA